MRRWNPWNAAIATVLIAGAFALGRLLGVDPIDALVDAIVTGFIGFVILEYWRSGGTPVRGG